MTLEECAEKVFSACMPWDKPNQIRLIAAEIKAYASYVLAAVRWCSRCDKPLVDESAIRADEREACAKVADKYAETDSNDDAYIKGWHRASQMIAKGIRSRGEK